MSRIYIIHDVFRDIEVKCKYDNLCVFCQHCTDVLWDYTNGPYMVFCDLNRPEVESQNEKQTCTEFKDVEEAGLI
jgi:hypothetical protein